MVLKNLSETELTNEEFKKIVGNSNKLVVVNFFSEWSMSCLMLSPLIEELAEAMSEVKFVKIDMEDNEEIVKECEVNNPCLTIFKNGEVIDKIFNAQSYEGIEEKIKKWF